MSLSDTKLRAIYGKPYTGKSELVDRDGLSTRISSAGTITWQYRCRFNGKSIRLRIGRYPDLKLSEARLLIPQLRNAINSGTDPRIWLNDRNRKTGKVTVKFCCEEFLAKRENVLKKTTLLTYQSVFRKHLLPAFENRHIEEVSLSEWIDFFDKIAKTNRVTAGAVLRHLKTVVSWCIRRQLIHTLDVLQLRVNDVGSPTQKGTRVLTILECGKIWRELDKSRATPTTLNSIKACMLTGARISELLKSKRSDFDLESMVWTVPVENSKTNTPIRRPITPALLEILKTQWCLYRVVEWSFPAPNDIHKPLGVASVNKFIRDVRAKVDIPHWRIHDFRRTISTRLSEAGVLPHVTEKMLGHVLGGVMAVYNKHDWLDEQAKAYEMWADKLMLSAHGGDKVTVLERRSGNI